MNSVTLHTPIGFLTITQSGDYITDIKYNNGRCTPSKPQTEILKEACRQLNEYFNGNLKEFSLPIQINSTPFRTKVLTELLNVKYGETVTYKELARRVGNPNAARAVGSAMRNNSLVIVVPCHRVLPVDGNIGNYSAGGRANKEWLLCLEKQNT